MGSFDLGSCERQRTIVYPDLDPQEETILEGAISFSVVVSLAHAVENFRIFFTTCALHWNCYVGKSTEESLDFDEEASLMNRLAKLLLSQPMCRWLNRPFVLALVPTQHLCRSA